MLQGLTYVCTFGLENKLRDNAQKSINLIRYGTSKPEPSAAEQVKVRMVSGDHIDTCREVAVKAGIITKGEAESDNIVMLGESFR